MALTEPRPNQAHTLDPGGVSGATARRGFRPTSRRRARIAVGAALAAIAVGGNVLVYTSLGDTTEVLQVTNDIGAGELVTADDLRVVEVALDATVPVVAATDIGRVANQYARVHLAAGTLVSDVLVQPTPLVAAGYDVVSVEIRPTRVPAGLRERSRVMIVLVPEAGSDQQFVTEGRVVAGGDPDAGDEVTALSVEVRQEDAARVAAGDDIRIALLDPGVDPVTEEAP